MEEQPIPEGQQMLFNEEADNPYLPENMERAFDSLKSKVYKSFPGARVATESVALDFTANKKYVRFLPTDSTQFDTLMALEELVLFDYPLDKPIIREGEYTPEPANDGGFHWLYGVVSNDFEFPPVDYEVINDIFLPEFSIDSTSSENTSSGRVASDSADIKGMFMGVELYSMYLTGHLNDEEADELLAMLKGEAPDNGRVDNSVWEQFIHGLKSVRNTLGSIFITPAYARRRINPASWCWGCLWNRSWRPTGSVRVMDGNLNQPLRGLKIVIHRGLKAITAYTDNNGRFYSYAKFGSRVTYTVHWRNRSSSWFGTRYFRIVKGWAYFTHKHHVRRHTRNDNITHNYDLTYNSGRANNLDELAACIFVAAHDFYHGNRVGFQRPRKNMRIRIYDKNGRAKHSKSRYWLLANQIRMYIRDENAGNINVSAKRAIITAFHELGHASHFALDGRCSWSSNSYCDDRDDLQDEILKESWAIYIEHHLGKSWFTSFDRSRQGYTFNTGPLTLNTPKGQGPEGKYTPLFFDLMDTVDQSRNGTLPDRPRDRVSGYTTAQMQHALKCTSTLQGLRDNLYNNYDNGTEEFLQELIDSYRDNLKPVD